MKPHLNLAFKDTRFRGKNPVVDGTFFEQFDRGFSILVSHKGLYMISIKGSHNFTGDKVRDRSKKERIAKPRVVGEILTIPSRPENVVNARKFAAKIARKCGFSDDDIFGIKLAVSEALSNAVIHGSPHGNNSFVQIIFLCNQGRMRIIVVDEGAFGPRQSGLGFESEGGRGLNLISFFMDYVSIHPSTSGTSITMIKNFQNNNPNRKYRCA
jgi:anti-sigma regulatory factor (Ser/Thr protein kinase)